MESEHKKITLGAKRKNGYEKPKYTRAHARGWGSGR
jgi:hypothetical protein